MINGQGQHDWRPTRAIGMEPVTVTCTRCEQLRQQINDLTKAHDLDAAGWRQRFEEEQRKYQQVLTQRQFDLDTIAGLKEQIRRLEVRIVDTTHVGD